MAETCQKCNQTIAEHGGGHDNACPNGIPFPRNRKAGQDWQRGYDNAAVGRYASTQTASYQLGAAAFRRSGAPRTKRKNRPNPG